MQAGRVGFRLGNDFCKTRHRRQIGQRVHKLASRGAVTVYRVRGGALVLGASLLHCHTPKGGRVNVGSQALALVDSAHGKALPGILLTNPACRGLAQTFQRGHAPAIQHAKLVVYGAGLRLPLVDVLHIEGVQGDTLFKFQH